MNLNYTAIIIAISAAILSGMGTAIIKLELKDLKIKLYQVERDLTEWKDKYYSAIQELIEVKADLEETLIRLSLIDMEFHSDQD
jgi:hypothetical protein